MTTSSPFAIAARGCYALLLLLIGLVLIAGGAYLLAVGGSVYYLLAGLATAASGVFCWFGDRRGAWAYGAMLIGTVAWSIWEAGFDGWALAPRIIGPVVVGIGYLVPAIHGTRSVPAAGATRLSGASFFAVGIVGAVILGTLAHAIGPADYADPQYQTGMTSFVSAPTIPSSAASGDWVNYGNDPGGSRFSGLDQLTPTNVNRLKVAWEVHTGPAPDGAKINFEATPIKIGDLVYTCTSYNDVIAIDAETGQVRWRFRSGISMKGRPNGACRGVAYFQVPNAVGPCARRVISNTIDARLIALDADSGRPCADFGVNGQTDLTTGMGPVDRGYYYVSSAPTIVRGKIVVGGWVNDGQFWGEPSGVIRAYDATTGKFAWAFDMGRPTDRAEPKPGETYTRSTPNSWAPMSADPALGLVYAPTGNATPDYYGVQRRPFDDKYSSAIVALDIDTGNVRWTFQTVHHDLWDYDVASQPTLIDIPAPGGVQRALVQATKRGEIFLLDRVTGKPLATVEERPVPQAGHMPGEALSRTQPFSVGMPSFGGPRWRERDMWGITPIDQMVCRIEFKTARYDGTMTPPGLTPNIAYPGYLGGVDWGGVSVDPTRSLLIVNANRMANRDVLVPRAAADAKGITPSKNGSPRSINGIVAQANTPYAASIQPFLSPLGNPCNKPPYGSISAIDLKTHKLVWTHPLGTAQDSGPLGIPSLLPIPLGVPNLGGSITTRGGLVFIAATQERNFRAFDIITGRELWNVRLPAGGIATPSSYWSDRSKRQFVIVTAGGHVGLRSKLGDSIIAYALPR